MKNRIAELRNEHRITQLELAESVGVSRQTIISIEKEKYEPGLALALRIAHHFSRQVEDVFQSD